MENNNKETNEQVDIEMTIDVKNKELEELLDDYNEHKDAPHLTRLVNHIAISRVLVPALMNDDEQPVPCFIQNKNGELYMPIYTSKEQIPEEPKSPIIINMPFIAVADMATNPELNVTGIVINAFSGNLIFKKQLLEKIMRVEKAKREGDIKGVQLTEEQYHVLTRKQVEFTLLPKKLFDEGEKLMDEISDGKEEYMDQLYEDFYQEKRLYPYLEEEFSVMTMNLNENLRILRVDFPERYMEVPSCYRVYLVWDKEKEEGRYFTIEKTENSDERLLGEVVEEISHVDHGTAPVEGAELQTIVDLVMKEEVEA
ncbi:SseB protein N-terminal domain-containing protein [Lachnospiraceae bacterium C7]|nr:SseB protein N-terminal domain-containing protein [Lachnospiraceae bacterium C7]